MATSVTFELQLYHWEARIAQECDTVSHCMHVVGMHVDMLITFFSAFVVLVFCRNTSIESSSLQTKMSRSKKFGNFGIQWMCRNAGDTYTLVILRVLPHIVELDIGMLLASRSGMPSIDHACFDPNTLILYSFVLKWNASVSCVNMLYTALYTLDSATFIFMLKVECPLYTVVWKIELLVCTILLCLRGNIVVNTLFKRSFSGASTKRVQGLPKFTVWLQFKV